MSHRSAQSPPSPRPARRRSPLRALAAAALLAAFAAAGPAGAQTAATRSADELRAEQQQLAAEISLSAEALAAIRAEIAALQGDLASITTNLVAATAAAQRLEDDLTRSEDRLGTLDASETALLASLDSRRALLSNLLRAAQRLGASPPPALIVRPEDALAAVRASILLANLLSEIGLEFAALQAELAELAVVRRETEETWARLRADHLALAGERERLSLLQTERQALLAAGEAELASEEDRIQDLQAQAEALARLIASLTTDPPVAAPPPPISDLAALVPSDPFAALCAADRLLVPASGSVVTAFGEMLPAGRADGTVISTRSGARVRAPADGTVVLAANRPGYGPTVILADGSGSFIVLAGLATIEVPVGRFVTAGEPIGSMGGVNLASAVSSPQSDPTRPMLYVAVDRNGTRLDPESCWP